MKVGIAVLVSMVLLMVPLVVVGQESSGGEDSELVARIQQLLDDLPADEQEKVLRLLLDQLRERRAASASSPEGASERVGTEQRINNDQTAPASVAVAESDREQEREDTPVEQGQAPRAPAAEPVAEEKSSVAGSEDLPRVAPVPEARSVGETRANPTAGEASAPDLAPNPIGSAVDQSAKDGCRPVDWLDFNQDGQLSGGDRYWRFLHLWSDANGNSSVEASEIHHLFDFGIRSVALDLRSYGAGEGVVGDIDVDDEVVFRLLKRRRKPNPRRGTLVLDAKGLAGAGVELTVRGRAVSQDHVVYQPPLELRLPDGELFVLECLTPLRR